MTRKQEKIMVDLFERAYKITKNLNYKQTAYILNTVSWGVTVDDDTIKTQLAKRSKNE